MRNFEDQEKGTGCTWVGMDGYSMLNMEMELSWCRNFKLGLIKQFLDILLLVAAIPLDSKYKRELATAVIPCQISYGSPGNPLKILTKLHQNVPFYI